LEDLQDWLNGVDQGGGFLDGREAFTWKDRNDIITLYDYKGREDPVPTWLTSTAMAWIPGLISDGKKV
jgi:hypothetical protein